MNILEFLKNGSGIHIKEKNKGKFTSYCGGNVTSACIAKAKASGNPTLVKRATFAANARKWKHKDGGVLYIFQEGGKTKNSFWKNAGNFLVNSGLGNALIEGGLGLLQSSSQNKSIAGATDIAKSEIDMEEQEAKQQAMQKAKQDAQNMLLLDPNNPNAFGGNIFQNYIQQQLYNEHLDYIKKNANNRKKQIDVQSQQMQGENTFNALSNILGLGTNALMNYLGNKVSNKTTTTNNSGGGWTMNYNSQYGNKSNYNNFLQTGSLPKMNSVVAPNTSWLNNNPL